MLVLEVRVKTDRKRLALVAADAGQRQRGLVLAREGAEADLIADRVKFVDRTAEEGDERTTAELLRDSSGRLAGGEEVRIPAPGPAHSLFEKLGSGAFVHRIGIDDAGEVRWLVERPRRHHISRSRAALFVAQDFARLGRGIDERARIAMTSAEHVDAIVAELGDSLADLQRQVSRVPGVLERTAILRRNSRAMHGGELEDRAQDR